MVVISCVFLQKTRLIYLIEKQHRLIYLIEKQHRLFYLIEKQHDIKTLSSEPK